MPIVTTQAGARNVLIGAAIVAILAFILDVAWIGVLVLVITAVYFHVLDQPSPSGDGRKKTNLHAPDRLKRPTRKKI